MTTASPEDQRRLLDLQQLDTRIARLQHKRRSLPALAALTELEGRAADLHRARIQAVTDVSDLEREVARAEADVDQVRSRSERTQARYDSGEGLSRELVAMQEELESLHRRQGVLEEAQLEVMDRLEAAEGRAAEIARQEESLRADQEHHEKNRDAEWEVIDAELGEATAARADLAASLGGSAGELLDLYERARERSGGLGAVAMYGHRAEGVPLDLTLAELGALDTAAPDAVVLSDDAGYVLVRMGEDRPGGAGGGR